MNLNLALEKACDVCEGTGKITTEFGEEILDFIRRHLGEKK